MDWYAFAQDVVHREPQRVVTRHGLTAEAPFFRDHFPGRPVMPGVLVTEAVLQAGRLLLGDRVAGGERWVLGAARAIRFSRFLEPGQWLVCDVSLMESSTDHARVRAACGVSERAEIDLDAIEALPQAASGRFVLRPPRVGGRASVAQAP